MPLNSLTDEEASFCKGMRVLKAAAPRNPIHPGYVFNLSLRSPKFDNTIQAPHSPRPLPLDPCSDLLEKEVSYRITEGLQAGESFHSQVWLAKPVGFESDSDPCLVFKFIVASHLIQRDEVPKEDYRTFQQVVDSQVEPFEQLWFLQGSFLPWFYGLHDVTMPWKETGKLFVMEYIPTTFRSIVEPERKLNVDDCFKNAYKNLGIAHKARITHGDIHLDNLLYDDTPHTSTPRLVFIDWRNDAKVDLRGEVMTFFHINRDICFLFDVFLKIQDDEDGDDDSDSSYIKFIKKTYKDEEIGERLEYLHVAGQLPDDFLTS
ncbi:hypothetical protein VNI00_000036 [Paramarasmius palmivorus]|uniref:Protein kinase domain-containing protein n=1 Tax=Paramarasmius palmivorus TaxID=297713 RepID=A0AAW0EBX6_9AGAR